MLIPRKFFVGLFLLLLSLTTAHSTSGKVTLKPDHPDQYTVVKSDTLWDISARFLQDPWKWPEIWHVNPDIANPHLIYPGDVIVLTWKDGKPQLQIKRGHPNVKLSPSAREVSLDDAIPAIPIDAIRQFLNGTRVVGKDELDKAGYIVAIADEHLIGGSGNKIYVRKLESTDKSGRYTVLRKTQPYKDPISKEIIGYEALHVGEASLTARGDPSTLVLNSTTREAVKGDRLLPVSTQAILHQYVPRAPEKETKGQIISVIDGVSQIGQYQVVVLNLGTKQGLELGHVLSVFQAGIQVRDTVKDIKGEPVTLPEEHAGEVMVFRTFERVSYALVMDAERPIHLYDTVSNPR